MEYETLQILYFDPLRTKINVLNKQTNKSFYIGANSRFSAIDTSLLDRFNSRMLSSRLNPISYITRLSDPNDQFLHQLLVRLHSLLVLATLPLVRSIRTIATNAHGGGFFEYFLFVTIAVRRVRRAPG